MTRPIGRHMARAAGLPVLLAALLAVGPTPAEAHGCGADVKVRAGDTLARIAIRCGGTVRAFLAANPQIDDPAFIYAGELLRVPVGARASSHRHTSPVAVRADDVYAPRRDPYSPGYVPGDRYRGDDRYERRKRRAFRRMLRQAYREGVRDGRGAYRYRDDRRRYRDDEDDRRRYRRYRDDDDDDDHDDDD